MTIRALNLQYRAKTPVLISEKDISTSNYTTTLDYIPGSSVFGAIGYNLIKSLQTDPNYKGLSEVLTKGFTKGMESLSGKIKEFYENLTSINDKEDSDNNFIINVSDFLPIMKTGFKTTPPLMSIMQCRMGGSEKDKKLGKYTEKHLSDSTLFMIKNIVKLENPMNSNKFIKPPLCPINNCCGPLKKSAQSCYIDASDNNLLKSKGVGKYNKLGIAIDPKVRTSQAGILFNQEFIARNQEFSGTILFDDSKIDSKKLLEASKVIYVGNRRNVGFGTLELVNFNEKDSNSAIDTVLKSLVYRYTKNIKDQNEYFKELNVLNNKIIIPFYLGSNVTKNSIEQLQNKLTEFGKPEIRFIQSKVKILRLRIEYKKDWLYEAVIERGSVGYISIDLKSNDEEVKQKILQQLAIVEIQRVGTLRLKGLGQFHFFPDIFYNQPTIVK